MRCSIRWAVALVIWSTPALVFGCSCVDLAARGACPLMKDAKEAIFSGTVLAAENPPDSGTIEGQIGKARYTFRVEEAFSSGIPKQVDVYSGRGGADCSVHFRIGEKYLVDSWRGSNGSISASICSKTRLFRDSDPLLAELRLIRDGKKPDSLFGVLRRTQEPWGGASDPAYNQPLGDRAITLRLGAQEFHAKSGADGSYSFRDLAPGEYTVWADLPPKLVLGEYILDRSVPSLVIAADACCEYDLKALPTGRISGQVRAQDGTGVSGWNATDIQLFRADKYTETPKGWMTAAGGISPRMAAISSLTTWLRVITSSSTTLLTRREANAESFQEHSTHPLLIWTTRPEFTLERVSPSQTSSFTLWRKRRRSNLCPI